MHHPNNCKECQYDQIRREYTNKRYDPILSRSSYRTFDYYGRQNGNVWSRFQIITNIFVTVRQLMQSLVDDVKTFQQQLIKAEICKCKLSKYENEYNEAEKFLEKLDQV